MPQYIQNPSLIGAQMADDLSKQRMNLVGQGISQAVEALNKQAALDTAAEYEAMKMQGMVEAGFTPTGAERTATFGPLPQMFPALRQQIAYNRAARGMFDPTLSPESSKYRLGYPIAPAAEGRSVDVPGMAKLTPAQVVQQYKTALTDEQKRALGMPVPEPNAGAPWYENWWNTIFPR